ncbi:sulfite exporter TauE/SafE family protein [Pseudooceanicola spongiae]|jgi:uncharacterized protein|uniref:Probable membrane transporter protein n=1 Tax=Pseudooceanicola spongiae TaxID=2613965 RepID=A0A7L9WPD8_9RHOB|nr:sulfite exporter TauE/SafE family protein [Pseudooceanicola spongiae]QOL82109.1 TSUP family transporter [Pseudooceanicola spongiae]|tara:strand:+ start:382 stop:1110 length:729 start_codon:yes stop_codon:yes gene_type:complete
MELIALISLAVFIAAVLRGLTGFGFALAAVPAMSLLIAPSRAVTVAILLQCMVGLRDTVRMRALVNRRALVLMTIGAVIGTPLGILALTRLSPDAMRIVLAVLVGIGLAALMLKVRLGAGRRTAIGAGFFAGLFSGLAAMPGPPAIAYFLGTATPAKNTRASLMVFFFLTSLVALPGLAWAGQIDRQSLIQAAFALPALLIGTWAGGQAFNRLDEGGYRTAAIALLAVTAALTALRGVAGLL